MYGVARRGNAAADLEAALDAQIIGALAPGTRIVLYEASDDERGFLDAVRTAIFDEQHAPSILSISFGWPESCWTPAALDVLDELFTAAALVGMSVFCSSGDNGAEIDAEGVPHVVAPASSPFVHACDATAIASESGVECEVAWERSGGGFSTNFPIPSWQRTSISNAGAVGIATGRGVPDIAAQELPGYYVFLDGTELAAGGTSAVAPLWAARAARLNQQLKTRIGFFAPMLYAQSETLLGDSTTGSNGRYQAGIGWDACTGLGVPVVLALAKALGA